ncbi:MAG: hemolysin-III related-domain-containing protein [Monoraphidium minutum]|nr:MAG: hemolysin-III related-domain-containing protein [Monoraphidium minutum]
MLEFSLGRGGAAAGCCAAASCAGDVGADALPLLLAGDRQLGAADAAACIADADAWEPADGFAYVTPTAPRPRKGAVERPADGAARAAAKAWRSQRSPAAARPYRRGLSKEEAPLYVTYPYVVRGYTSGGSYARCLRAALEPHAETLNAWTMVAASVLSLLLLRGALSTVRAAGAGGGGGSFWAGVSDEAPFWLLTGATLLHAPFSIGFHLFRGTSAEVYNLWRRLDQVFIFQVSQLLALGIAWFVYDSWWGLALNLAAAAATAQLATRSIWGLNPGFQRHRGRMVAFVGAIAACYWAPMGVQAARDAAAWRAAAAGGGAAPPPAAAAHALGAAAALVGGGAVFALGLPERLAPGVFDIVGFSHQWMHVAASAAHAFEYAFVLEMWARRRRGAQW